MTKTLHFDLSKDATRAHILETVLSSFSQDERILVERQFESITVARDHHHTLADVDSTIEQLSISDNAKRHLHQVYDILAHAEAKVHECPVDQTHFHEVGKGSAVQNAARICHAIDKLGPSHITATCVQPGSGKIQCAHGLLDIPAPATQAILDLGIPTCPTKQEGELCTPTSAALIKHYVEEFI